MTETPQQPGTEIVSATADRSALAGIYNPDLDFRKLASEAAYYSRGYKLVDKSDLIGVPHVVIAVTWRPGFPRQDKTPGDYVSIEAIVADHDTLYSNPVKHMLPVEPENLNVFPNDMVVYNDSSTGVRRTMTELFDTLGMIDVGGARSADENPFDKPFQSWTAGQDAAQSTLTADRDGVPFRYIAIRGLRRSDYESPYGPATTYYYG